MDASGTRTRRILVVDDTPEIHGDFRRILHVDHSLDALAERAAAVFGETIVEPTNPCRIEYRIDSAYQGQEAREMVAKAQAQGDPYCLMFVDMRMPPGWDGLTTVAKIWEVAPDIQAVICTAYTDHTWDEMTRTLGASDRLIFLHKPFGHLEIQQAALTLSTKWQLAHEMRQQLANLEDTIVRLQSEIERRTRAELQAEFHQDHDPLTGLPNRSRFVRHLESLNRDAHPANDYHIGIATVDIDGFRVVSNGLEASRVDELIINVARRLETHNGGELDMVARAGGDRFLVLMTKLHDRDEGLRRLRRLATHLESPFDLGDELRVRLSASAGVTFATGVSAPSHNYLAQADLALNAAKSTGRGRIAVFEPEMHRANIIRLHLEEALRDALDEGGLSLHYQPIINLDTGEITGFEALCRWEHPTRGMISPVEFIPVAEDSGLIVPLGRWALEEACRSICALRESTGRPLTMSVNVAAMQLYSGNFAQEYRELLVRGACPGDAIRLELTESGLMRDPVRAASILTEIRALDTQIYIDDFGTGYSSLAYLRRLPVDALKIDRCFVAPLEHSEEDRAIAQTIITLAHTMNLVVVAEGIETPAHARILTQMGCDKAQGYYYSRPVPFHQAMELVTKRAA
jgi:diguanylate cyclase (GGDEF)-like protein